MFHLTLFGFRSSESRDRNNKKATLYIERPILLDNLSLDNVTIGDDDSSITCSPSSSSWSKIEFDDLNIGERHLVTSTGTSTTPSMKKGLSIAMAYMHDFQYSCSRSFLLVLARPWKWEEEEQYVEYNNSPEISNTTSASRGSRKGYHSRLRALGSRYRPVNTCQHGRPSSSPLRQRLG